MNTYLERHGPWLLAQPTLLAALVLNRPSSLATQWGLQAVFGLLLVGTLGLAAWLHERDDPRPDLFDPGQQSRLSRLQWGFVLAWSLALAVLGVRVGSALLGLCAVVAVSGLRIGGRRGWGAGLVALGLLLGLWMLAADSLVQEQVWSDFFGHLDAKGRHWEATVQAQELAQRAWFGATTEPVASLRRPSVSTWTLPAMRELGIVPVALLLVLMTGAWVGLARTLARLPATQESRRLPARLGATLAASHAVCGAIFVLWTFGLTRRPFGPGLPPFVLNAAWWPLTAALLTCTLWVLRGRVASLRTRLRLSPARAATVFAVGAGLLALPLLNVAQLKTYQSERTQTATRAPVPTAMRPTILDRRGLVLAHDVPAIDVWIEPRSFLTPCQEGVCRVDDSNRARVQRLVQALHGDADAQLRLRWRLSENARFNETGAWYGVAFGVDPQLRTAIEAVGMGVRCLPSRRRAYSQGSLFAHAMGFVALGEDGLGMDGLERWLRWRAEPARPQADKADAFATQPIATTLDRQVQELARRALSAAVQQHGAVGGAAVVADAKTGALRAMVSLPDFDPNDSASFRLPYQPERLFNHALATPIAATAMLTPLVAAGMLERGQLDVASLVATTPFALQRGAGLAPMRFVDVHPHGPLTAGAIITRSSNAGAARLNLNWRATDLHAHLQCLGLHGLGSARRTGLEVWGWMLPPSEWTPGLQADLGQAAPTSLVGLLQAYQPLASDGVARPIHLLQTATVPRWPIGRTLDDCTEKELFSGRTRLVVQNMLASAAGPEGTTPKVKPAGVSVAGKGASFRIDSAKVPETAQAAGTVFVGMLPAESPRWLVGVLLVFDGTRQRWAGETAAPVFTEIAGALGRSMQAGVDAARSVSMIDVPPGLGPRASPHASQPDPTERSRP